MFKVPQTNIESHFKFNHIFSHGHRVKTGILQVNHPCRQLESTSTLLFVQVCREAFELQVWVVHLWQSLVAWPCDAPMKGPHVSFVAHIKHTITIIHYLFDVSINSSPMIEE